MRMRNSIRYLFVLPLMMILLIWQPSCGRLSNTGSERERSDSIRLADSLQAEQRRANDLTEDALEYADSILATLPLERRAAMLLMPAAYARMDAATMTSITHYTRDLGVGGIVLLKGSLVEAAEIADSIRSLQPEGIFIAVDAENGLKMRFEDAPEFPWNRELGRLTDDQIMYEFGREIARESRIVGINMILGPVMDILPGEASHGIMRKRSLGSNPNVVADLAIAYSRGVEDGNVISVAKHFPGHGSANVDSHRALGEVKTPRSRIDSIDLYPFRRYVAERLSGVMVGHLAVEALDSIRRPAVVSPVIMQDILRRQFGFKGLIITDAINMEGALGVKAWQTIKAGADIVIAPSDTEGELRAILEAVKMGWISEDVIAERCRRILFYRFLTGANRRRERLTPDEIRMRVNEYAPAIRDSIQRQLRQSTGALLSM